MTNTKTPSPTTYPDAPRVAVGAIVFNNGNILLVKRGKPPAEGVWAIPGGSVRLGETLKEAAEREILEETGVTIKAQEPTYTFDAVHRDESGTVRFHYVIVDLMAEYISGDPIPGDDALDARWFSSEEIKAVKVSDATLKLLNEKFNFGQ